MSSLDTLYQSLSAAAAARGEGAAALASCAGDLARPAVPAEAEQTNDAVLERFVREPGLVSLVVVEGRRPIGLINRHIFMEAYARPFAREVFGRRSCIAWMDKQPLVVDRATPLEELVQRAVAAGKKALDDGFVVTSGGTFAGHGTGIALVQAMAAAEAEKTHQLLESIRYASRIQRSQLRASDEALAGAVADHALLWEPRDVVGGDCYLFRRLPGGLFGAVLDCTGHGVPGAFMTLIALSVLDQALASGSSDPGAALTALNAGIKRALGQVAVEASEDGAVHRSDDGLDGACLWLPDGRAEVAFAGARLPLLVVPPGDGPVEVVDGERASVGYLETPADRRWATRTVALPPGALLAVATDGVTDQLGGPKRLALGRKRLADFLGERRGAPTRELVEAFGGALLAWQGAEARRDDVALLLLRPGATP